MDHIMLVMDHQMNRRLVKEWLGKNYEVVSGTTDMAIEDRFNLCILDGPAFFPLELPPAPLAFPTDRLVWEELKAGKVLRIPDSSVP